MNEEQATQAEQDAVAEQDKNLTDTMPVMWHNEKLWVKADSYEDNDQTALVLIDGGGYQQKICTVNPESDLNDNMVWIKSYAENKGILEALVRAKVLVANGVVLQNGNVEFVQCQILDEALEALGMEVPPSELGDAGVENLDTSDGTDEDSDVGEVLEDEQNNEGDLVDNATPGTGIDLGEDVQGERAPAIPDDQEPQLEREMTPAEKLASHISDADLAEAIDEALSVYGERAGTSENPSLVVNGDTPKLPEVKETFTFPSTKKD